MVQNIMKILMKNSLIARAAEDMYCKVPYYFMNGRAFNPLSVVLLVTYKCNLNCKMCFYYNENESDNTHRLIRERATEELKPEQIYRLIDEMHSLRIRVLTIHGGEPLVYPGIFDISKYASRRGIMVNFITNGTLISEETAKNIVDAKIGNITFSIDGPENIHDTVRNRQGTFQKLIRGINNLREMEKKRFQIPDLSVSTYISGINAEKISELHDIVKGTGIKRWGVGLITYNNAKMAEMTKEILGITGGRGQGNLENLKDEIKEIDIEKLLKERELLKSKNNDYRIDLIFPSVKAIKNYYDVFYNEVDHCLYPWARVIISPYGEVFPCVNLSMIDYKLGNIKEKSLKEIWNSKEFIEFRRKIKKNKLFPMCSKCCVINNTKPI
jgi:radical SAM protein with 4Fe4S-binding SPASM domain